MNLAALVYTLRRTANKRLVQRKFASLHGFEESLYSQNGEDGIIRELLFRVGFANRYFVEFGAGDGAENNTSLLASHYGWSGLYIEGDAGLITRLRRMYSDKERVKVVQAMITRENICDLLREQDVPGEFDILSIDIDGNDYWVWNALSQYRPRIVVIEYNASFVPPRRWVMAYDPNHRWDGTNYYGASLESYAELGKKMGYDLVCTDSRGVNAFFVRSDVREASGLDEVRAEKAYHPLRYGLLRRHHPDRTQGRPYVEI